MTWLVTDHAELDELTALTPVGAEWSRFADTVARHAPHDLAELCRVRIAQLHGCGAEAASRPAPKAAEIESWAESSLFTPAERAALAVAEKWPWRVHDVSDADVEELSRHLDLRAMIALVTAISVADAECRLRIALEA